MILCSTGLEVLVPKEGMFPSEDITMTPMNWKLQLPPGHFRLLISTVLGWLYQGETGLLPHNGGKEEYDYNTRDPQGHLSLSSCPVKSMENYNNPIQTELQMAKTFKNEGLGHCTR